jgi:hypothetical protein
MFLSIVDAMQKNRIRRLRWWIAAALLLILGTTTIVLGPPGLRGPDRVASEFLDALIQTPADAARLRAAARLAEADDPQTLLQGLSTNVTLTFLQARQTQGISQDIRVLGRLEGNQRYTVTLRVAEASTGPVSAPRDFIVQLQPATDGTWRIVSLRAAE